MAIVFDSLYFESLKHLHAALALGGADIVFIDTLIGTAALTVRVSIFVRAFWAACPWYRINTYLVVRLHGYTSELLQKLPELIKLLLCIYSDTG